MVKHLGDGTLAEFGSASAAVEAAVGAQVAAAQFSDTLGQLEEVSIRIGLAVGDVDDLIDDIAGMPVVVAARLCDRAADSEILADQAVADLTWGRTSARFEPAGTFELKGCPGSTTTVRLQWTRPSESVRLPPMLTRALTTEFVGRQSDLDVLHLAYEKVRAGEPAVVSVTGEAGMGKTSLVARFADSVQSDGAQVLAGACTEGPQAPFQAWAQAIAGFAYDLPLPLLLAAASDQAPVLARIAPQVAERLSIRLAETSAETPQRLYEAVADLLNRRAEIAPVVVVLDDMHWTGEDSAQMLRSVAAAAEGPMLFVVAHRQTDVGRGHAIVTALQDVGRDLDVQRHKLAGLSRDDLEELLTALGGDESLLRDQRLGAIEGRGGGNPLFSRELIRDGSLPDEEVSTAGDMVRRRLGRLPVETQRVLTVAALLGFEFEVSVLERCEMGIEENQILRELEIARSAGLVEEVEGSNDRLVFIHGLVPEVLVAQLSAARRARLHLRLAAALGDGADPAALAHHYAESRLPAGLQPAVEHSRRAARQQAQALAYEQASQTLNQVLGVIEDVGPDRDDLKGWVFVDFAEYRYLAGDVEQRQSAAARAGEIARRLDDVAMLQQAAIHRAGFPQPGRPDPVAVELLNQAIDATPADDLGTRAELLSILAYYRGINEGRRQEADELARSAIAIARTTGSPRDLAEALAARAFLLTGAPGVDEQLALLDELESLIELLESPADRERHQQYVHRQRGPVLLRSGDLSGFEAELVLLDEFARSRRSWIAAATTLMWRGMLAQGAGDLEAAEGFYDEMAVVGQDQTNFAESYAFALFVVRREQGRLPELLDVARDLVAGSAELRAFELPLALIELAAGNIDIANRMWEDWSKESFARLPHDVTGSALLSMLTELCVRFGDVQDAANLDQILADYEGELLVAAWGICSMGAADRYHALLSTQRGLDDRASRQLEAARRLETSLGFVAGASIV